MDTGQDFDLHMDRLIRAMDGILQTASGAKEQDADGRNEGSGQPVEPVSRSRTRFGWAAVGTTLLIAACLTLWTVERREQEKAHEAAVAEAARQSAEAARREAEAKAHQEQAATAEAAQREAEARAHQEQAATAEAARREAEAKARREQVATSVPALYRELQRVSQPEARDPTGKVTVEAATIHVLSCEGPGGNGVQIYLYEYAHRPAFRAVAPPNWGTALGGRDFSNFGDAARAGCGIPPAR